MDERSLSPKLKMALDPWCIHVALTKKRKNPNHGPCPIANHGEEKEFGDCFCAAHQTNEKDKLLALAIARFTRARKITLTTQAHKFRRNLLQKPRRSNLSEETEI
jgi:hypothetical protein